MVAPPEDQIGHGAASYVPEPFEGLPQVFAPEEHAPRNWRKLRPHKSSRPGESDEASDAAPAAPAADPMRGRQHAVVPPEPAERHQPPRVAVAPVAQREHDEAPQVAAAPQVTAAPQVDIAPQAPPQVPVPAQPLAPPAPFSQPTPLAPPAPMTATLASLAPTPPAAPPAPLGPPTGLPTAPHTAAPIGPPPGPRPQPRHAAPSGRRGGSGVAGARVATAHVPVQTAPAAPPAVFERQAPPAAHAAAVTSEPPAITVSPEIIAPPAPPDGLPGYQPLPYEPNAGDGFGPLNIAFPPGQLGTVYPTRRTGRSVWVVLILIVALAAGLVGWRVRDHGSSTPAAVGVDYRSLAGHFSAHFPAAPAESSWSTRSGRLRATYHGAAVPDDATTVVETDLTGPLPRDQHDELAQFIAGFQSSGDFTVTRLHAVSFGGHPARQGSYLAPGGQLDTVLFVMYSARRIFVLMAPSGAPFETLRNSLAVRP